MDKNQIDKLNEWASQPEIFRECYGNDRIKKPNDHCHWDILYSMGWIENDEHFRNRIKAATKEK